MAKQVTLYAKCAETWDDARKEAARQQVSLSAYVERALRTQLQEDGVAVFIA